MATVLWSYCHQQVESTSLFPECVLALGHVLDKSCIESNLVLVPDILKA